ncbi:hypothetical protein F5Y19DRAFT_489857 [Xylariaceae sp. FL1651]|nr:hypothetical protein F5Y19DRAFT_489857 [Xylariaceae sp. FL1651]
MESASTPRISASMLDSYVGQNVIVVGKVMQLRGESAILDADGQVNAILNPEAHLMAGNGAQIIGRVNPDMSVKVYNAMDLGSNVGMLGNHSFAFKYTTSTGLAVERILDDELSQLAIPHEIPPSSQLTTAQSTRSSQLSFQGIQPPRPAAVVSSRSSLSEIPSSSGSLDDELSQLVIQDDISLPSQVTNAQSTQPRPTTATSSYSSSSEILSSSPESLEDELSRLISHHDIPPSSQLFTVQRTQRPRSVTAMSSYSSSSEIFSSSSEYLDDELPRLPIGAASPSLQSTIDQSTQPSQQGSQSTQLTQYCDSSTQTSPLRQREVNPQTPGSPSSTGKLSYGYSSPSQSPVLSTPSPVRRGRLYRSRSGSLVNAAEIRQHKEREKELFDVVLKGIADVGETSESPLQRSIVMSLDEGGRWRIDSIVEP